MLGQAKAKSCGRVSTAGRMRTTALKRESEHCHECGRGNASYRVRLGNQSNMALCHRCAVRLVVGLVTRIASAERRRPASSSKPTSGRQT